MNKRKFSIDWSKASQKLKEMENAKHLSHKNRDDRMFIPQFRDDGTFQAIIRFLPSKETISGESVLPFVDVYTHSFKGPGGWLVENCPTTIKQKCPICEANALIWEEDPEILRRSKRKRRLSYYANILVIKDPQTPENNGKVFIFRFGTKIYEKIMEKWQPEEGSILKPIQVFDYYDGANFNLIIKKIKVGEDLLPNYDSSSFDAVSCIGTDEEIEKIQNSLFSLKDFQSPDKFKSYEELKDKLLRVTGQTILANTKLVKNSQQVLQHEQLVQNIPEKVQIEDIKESDDIFSGTDDSFFESLQSE